MGQRLMKPLRVKRFDAWLCAGCAGRWSHACGGATRLLVSRYDDDTAFVAYCGVSFSWKYCNGQAGGRPTFDIQMHVLKAALRVQKQSCRIGTNRTRPSKPWGFERHM